MFDRARRLTRYPVAMVALAVLVGAAVLLAVGQVFPRDRDGFVARVVLPQFRRVRLPSPAQDPGTAIPPEVDLAMDEAQGGAGADPSPRPGAIRYAVTPLDEALEADPADAAVVPKSVTLDGSELGTLRVHVTADSRLLFDAAELRRLLKPHGVAARVPGDGLLDAAQLRAAGLALRYDAANDVVALVTR